jgi:hypothetical protein
VEKYLVISRCEDEPHIQYMPKEEVIRYLNDDWAEYDTITEEQMKDVSLDQFPARSVLIMCGKICQKIPVTQVTQWVLV